MSFSLPTIKEIKAELSTDLKMRMRKVHEDLVHEDLRYDNNGIELIEMKSKDCESKKIGDIIIFEKGKPPAQQPYFGPDAELYLTPEYLRGRSSAELVKPSANAVRAVDGDTIVLWDGSNAGEFSAVEMESSPLQ